MKRPLFWVTLLAAALSIGLAACSGDSDSTEGSSDEDSHGVFPTGSPAAEPESTLAPEVTPTAALLAHIIFINGQVIMMDTGQPIAQALAVLGEEILLVATEQAVLALAGPDTQMIDLAGRALLPGFVDPHNHIYNQISRGLRQETIGATYGEAQQRLLAAGTTTVANGGVSPDRLDDFLPIVNSGELRVRTSVYLVFNNACGELLPEGLYLEHAPISDPAAMFRIPGIKFFTDGGSCGALALSVPASNPFGDLWISAEELAAAVIEVQSAGYQVAIHALGDRGLDTALDAIAIARAAGSSGPPPRIEHNRVIRTDQLPRYAELGVVPVVFGESAACDMLDGGPWAGLFVDGSPSVGLRPWFDPWRALLDATAGLPVAWHSDFPFFSLEPLTHIWSLVTRQEFSDDGSLCAAPAWLAVGGVTVEEALRMMTLDAAFALLMDEKIGSLEAGKFADLVVLSQNPLTIDPDALIETEVLMTMVGGRVEYCAAGSEELCPSGGP